MADEMRRFKGSDEKNPFEAMSERFDRAALLFGLDEDLYAVMRVPSREIKVYIPVTWIPVISRYSKDFEFSIISPAARQREEYDTRPMSHLMR